LEGSNNSLVKLTRERLPLKGFLRIASRLNTHEAVISEHILGFTAL